MRTHVAVIGTAFHDGAQVDSQFFVGRATDKVPAVIDRVDAQIWSQHERVGLRSIGVLALRLTDQLFQLYENQVVRPKTSD
jgi:hypothetical protein